MSFFQILLNCRGVCTKSCSMGHFVRNASSVEFLLEPCACFGICARTSVACETRLQRSKHSQHQQSVAATFATPPRKAVCDFQTGPSTRCTHSAARCTCPKPFASFFGQCPGQKLASGAPFRLIALDHPSNDHLDGCK